MSKSGSKVSHSLDFAPTKLTLRRRTSTEHVAGSHHPRRRFERRFGARETSSRSYNGSTNDSELGVRSQARLESDGIISIPFPQSSVHFLHHSRSAESTEIKNPQYATSNDDEWIDACYRSSGQHNNVESARSDETHLDIGNALLRFDLGYSSTIYRLPAAFDRNDKIELEVIVGSRWIGNWIWEWKWDWKWEESEGDG